jgi:hypothetical protein
MFPSPSHACGELGLSASADGEIQRDLKATPLDVDEEFAPALRALPHPAWKPTSSFLPSGVAPISTSMQVSGLAGLALDQKFEWQPRSAPPVAPPVGQHEARHASVGDRGAVRPAVAQAQQGSGIGEHLADRLMVAGDIVHQREVQIPVLSLGDVIVGTSSGVRPSRAAMAADALLLAGFIVRRVAHDKELVPALDDELAELREFCHFGFRRLVGKNLAPDFGIAQSRPLLGDAQIFESSSRPLIFLPAS